jgi:hypothetical protein
MPKPFYKHKPLLDENLPPRQVLSQLNAHFDVSTSSTTCIMVDERPGSLQISYVPRTRHFDLAMSLGRVILTINAKDFRPLLRDDAPGVIGIPEAWSTTRLDTKLTALLKQHNPTFFRGHYRALVAPDLPNEAS